MSDFATTRAFEALHTLSQTLLPPPPAGKRFSYGTAGFREKYLINTAQMEEASVHNNNVNRSLHTVFYKVGVLAALRSICSEGRAVGVMVTASHNALCDNGVKIVDPSGGMMTQAWEGLAELAVNEPNVDAFERIIAEKLQQALAGANKVEENNNRNCRIPVVVVGRDMRFHSPILADFVVQGAHALAALISLGSSSVIIDVGEVITPVVHFVVADYNSTVSSSCSSTDISVDPSLWKSRYFSTLNRGYRRLIGTGTDTSSVVKTLTLDTAFGVGSKTLDEFLTHIGDQGLAPWEILMVNREGEGEVNAGCGAEHVQKNQLPPCNLAEPTDRITKQLLCSFDGDGDRIVFHAYRDTNPLSWVLLDGDRIATLIALFLFEELRAAELIPLAGCNSDGIRAGVVQTAYANGGSGQFLRKNGIEVLLAKTGVKFIHHKAEELDVGIYFEANGHGTVLFSERFKCALAEAQSVDSSNNARKTLAFERLQATLEVVNQTVGDALSDLLFSLSILSVLGLSYEDWHQFYQELPSKQVKLAVPDKSKLICSEDETYLVEPKSLQDQLNVAMASVTNGRCFVRPSGTEDVVRIYAEAATAQEVEKLTSDARAAIHAFFG